ncbi:MAG TPA: type III pantothenate kinase [Aquificaceae bacterium]|nr:type III pantothenate kinase [Aquificaceae bacterium]HIQ48480.1 type III pantothenate kinase [Aquifex aeolicus]
MKLVTIDVGNSTVDLVVWEDNQRKWFKKLSHKEFEKLELMNIYGIAVSVKPSFNKVLLRKFPKVRFLKKDYIPVRIAYKTSHTLGIDRVLLAYSAIEFYGKDVILISAGTALVIDLILEGIFYGGFITLGVSKKLKALSEMTEGIPEFLPKKLNLSIGRSTEECVVGGVIKESEVFLKEVIDNWKKEYKRNFRVVITGGDGELFENLGVYDKFLIHKGLKKLLDANIGI